VRVACEQDRLQVRHVDADMQLEGFVNAQVGHLDIVSSKPGVYP
jgi:hypothetical protein